jgi:hypothetical protein
MTTCPTCGHRHIDPEYKPELPSRIVEMHYSSLLEQGGAWVRMYAFKIDRVFRIQLLGDDFVYAISCELHQRLERLQREQAKITGRKLQAVTSYPRAGVGEFFASQDAMMRYLFITVLEEGDFLAIGYIGNDRRVQTHQSMVFMDEETLYQLFPGSTPVNEDEE